MKTRGDGDSRVWGRAVDKVRVNGVRALRGGATRALIDSMDKPVTTAPEAAAASEAPPSASAPVKAATPTEVTTGVAGPAAGSDVTRVKSEKALRLAKALRENLRRRKVATRPARPSN